MTGRITSLSVAYYDFDAEPHRANTYDRPGTRVRVYYSSGRGPHDYYPSKALLPFLYCLAWNHEFTTFEMRGTNRLSIQRKNVLPNKT